MYTKLGEIFKIPKFNSWIKFCLENSVLNLVKINGMSLWSLHLFISSGKLSSKSKFHQQDN